MINRGCDIRSRRRHFKQKAKVFLPLVFVVLGLLLFVFLPRSESFQIKTVHKRTTSITGGDVAITMSIPSVDVQKSILILTHRGQSSPLAGACTAEFSAADEIYVAKNASGNTYITAYAVEFKGDDVWSEIWFLAVQDTFMFDIPGSGF